MVSINTFSFATTINSQIALMFTGNNEQCLFVESVFFEIEIDRTLMKSTNPFANIVHA
ncbi:unnamed protein product, partial [Rotaria sp. Silwood1]